MQLMSGKKCALCREVIRGDSEGCHCVVCGRPVHDECAKAAAQQPADDACPMCGSTAVGRAAHLPVAARAAEPAEPVRYVPRPDPVEPAAAKPADGPQQMGLNLIQIGSSVAVIGGLRLVLLNVLNSEPEFFFDVKGGLFVGIGLAVVGLGYLIRAVHRPRPSADPADEWRDEYRADRL